LVIPRARSKAQKGDAMTATYLLALLLIFSPWVPEGEFFEKYMTKELRDTLVEIADSMELLDNYETGLYLNPPGEMLYPRPGYADVNWVNGHVVKNIRNSLIQSWNYPHTWEANKFVIPKEAVAENQEFADKYREYLTLQRNFYKAALLDVDFDIIDKTKARVMSQAEERMRFYDAAVTEVSQRKTIWSLYHSAKSPTAGKSTQRYYLNKLKDTLGPDWYAAKLPPIVPLHLFQDID
jgi:hypothetical protein